MQQFPATLIAEDYNFNHHCGLVPRALQRCGVNRTLAPIGRYPVPASFVRSLALIDLAASCAFLFASRHVRLYQLGRPAVHPN
jgi:hypothetical protein